MLDIVPVSVWTDDAGAGAMEFPPPQPESSTAASAAHIAGFIMIASTNAAAQT
jgi:hypothetical protein